MTTEAVISTPFEAQGKLREKSFLDNRIRRHLHSAKPFMRIAVDIGGTFTDLVAVDDNGEIFRSKSLTTPDDLRAASTIA